MISFTGKLFYYLHIGLRNAETGLLRAKGLVFTLVFFYIYIYKKTRLAFFEYMILHRHTMEILKNHNFEKL